MAGPAHQLAVTTARARFTICLRMRKIFPVAREHRGLAPHYIFSGLARRKSVGVAAPTYYLRMRVEPPLSENLPTLLTNPVPSLLLN